MTIYEQIKQWARKRSVRKLFRNAPWFVRGRQSDAWRRKWAMQVLRQRRKFRFYIYLTYDIFNPNHNGGDGQWHRITDQRYGPLGPDTRNNVPTWANESLVRVHGNYPHDILINVVSWSYEETNQPGVLAFALPLNEVPLQSGRPIRYQFLRYADGIAPASLIGGDEEEADGRLLRAPSNQCVVDALEAFLLRPCTNRPIKYIPHSQYDDALRPFVNPLSCRGGREPKVPVKRETLLALLEAIRSNIDWAGCVEGFSVKVIKALCHIFQVNMVALDKNDRIIDRIDEYEGRNNHHATLAFYAFHGHMYLLADKEAVAGVVAVARDAHLETSHANLQLQSDTVTKQDGVFTVYEGGFELSPTLPGGVHLLLGQQDLRVYVLDLMNDHASNLASISRRRAASPPSRSRTHPTRLSVS